MPVHAPLYNTSILYECPDFKWLSVICETDERSIKKLLAPSPFKYVTNRYTTYFLDMQKCTLGPFVDSGILVPARFGDVVGGYMAYEFITSDVAMAAGREPWGYPKKLADVKMQKRGNRIHGTVARNGEKLIDIKAELSHEKIEYPETPSNPTLLYHVIPRPDGPGALIRRVISRSVEAFSQEQDARQYVKGKVVFNGTANDPLQEIEPTKVYGGVFTTGYYKSKWGKVLATLENNI